MPHVASLAVKVCVDTRGIVTAVTMLTVDGVPAPACGMVNFAYRQT